MSHKTNKLFAEDRRKQKNTEPIKFAVVACGKVVAVFAKCEYEAVGIATKDPDLEDHYPFWYDGYVYVGNQDETYENLDTYDGYNHPDDIAQPASYYADKEETW
jgi:hypothetical protein